MVAGFLVWIAALVFPTLPAAAQDPVPLAPGHWSYDFLEALDAAGFAEAWMTDVRPVSAGAVAGELRRVEEHGFGATELVSAWLDRLEGERPETAGGGVRTWLEAGAGYRGGQAFLDPGRGQLYTHLDGGLVVGDRGGVRLHHDRRAREHFDGLRTAVGAVRVGPLTVVGGRQTTKAAGPGSVGAQVGGRVPLDGLYVVSRERTGFPGLGWLTGPVAWQFSLGPWQDLAAFGPGWLGLGALVGRPTENLRFSVVRTARFGRAGSPPITPVRLLRTLFLVQNEPGDWDDQKLEVSFRYRWRALGLPLVTYLVLAQEDAPLYLDPGVVAGARAGFLTDAGLVMAGYEYSAYGSRARWCLVCEEVVNGRGVETNRIQGAWYRHGFPVNRLWSRREIPVGDPLGGYGAAHRLQVFLWTPGAAVRLRTWAALERREERNLLLERWPGERRLVGAEAAVSLGPGGEVSAAAAIADGPEIEREWGLRVAFRAVLGWGEEDRERPAPAGATRPRTPLDVEPGATVRVRTDAVVDREVRGTLRAVTDSTLVVAPTGGGEPVELSRRLAERIRVRTGSGRATFRGAFVGAALGTIAGIVIDQETGRYSPDGVHLNPHTGARIGAAVGGALLGALVGRALPVDRWRDARPTRRNR